MSVVYIEAAVECNKLKSSFYVFSVSRSSEVTLSHVRLGFLFNFFHSLTLEKKTKARARTFDIASDFQDFLRFSRNVSLMTFITSSPFKRKFPMKQAKVTFGHCVEVRFIYSCDKSNDNNYLVER